MSPKASRVEVLDGMRILRNVNFTVTTLIIRLDDADDELVASLNTSGLGRCPSMQTLSIEAGVPSLTFFRSEPLATQKRTSSRGSTSASADGPLEIGSVCSGGTLTPPRQGSVTSSSEETNAKELLITRIGALIDTDPETLLLYHQEASYRMLTLKEVDMEFVSIVEMAWNEEEIISLTHSEVVERYWATSDEQQQRAGIAIWYNDCMWRFVICRIAQELSIEALVARELLAEVELVEFGEISSLENRCYLAALAAERLREKAEEEIARQKEVDPADPENPLLLPPKIGDSPPAKHDVDEAHQSSSSGGSAVIPPHPPIRPDEKIEAPLVPARRRSSFATIDAICTARLSPKPSYASASKFDQPMESLFLAWLYGGNPAVFIELEAVEEKVRIEIAIQWRDEHSVIGRRAKKLAELSAGAKQALSFHETEAVSRYALHGSYFTMLREASSVLETFHRRHLQYVEYVDEVAKLQSLETREYITTRRIVSLREEAERAQRNEDDKVSRLLRIEHDEALALQRLQFERYVERELEAGVIQTERVAWRGIEEQFADEYRPARIAQLEFESRAVTLVKTLPVCEALFYPERSQRSDIMEREEKEFRLYQSLEVTSYLAARRNHLINADIAAQMKAMDIRHGLVKSDGLKRRSSTTTSDAPGIEGETGMPHGADAHVPAA